MGCHEFADAAADYCPARLAPHTFTLAGTSYSVKILTLQSLSSGFALNLHFEQDIGTAAAFQPLIFRIAGQEFRIDAASADSDGWQWRPSTAIYTAGNQVSVSLIDPTQTPPPPGPGTPGTGGQPVLELPRGPLKLALWTDRSSYRPGQQLRLYRSLDPRRLRDEHAVLLYLQRVGSEQRTYLALHANGDRLRSEPADQFGQPEGAFLFHVPDTVDRQQTWQGPAPLQPGLWQFVMELHSRSESIEPKRIWAKFMVGPGRVLNRRGFQREITQEMTLPGDRVHYLLDRLLVRSGATLRLQAGALLRAHGPSAEIVVEPGSRILAEGTREAPVVLTCSLPAGRRAPGCWAGLRLQAGSALTATRLLVLGFSRSAALVADPRAGQVSEDGTSAVTDSIQFRNRRAHCGWSGAGVEFRTHAALTLRNADTDPNHDPRPKRLQEVRVLTQPQPAPRDHRADLRPQLLPGVLRRAGTLAVPLDQSRQVEPEPVTGIASRVRAVRARRPQTQLDRSLFVPLSMIWRQPPPYEKGA